MTRKKAGRPRKSEGRKKKGIHATITPLAYRKYQMIPSGEASRRISKFLERMNPEVEIGEPGDRIGEVLVVETKENQTDDLGQV